MTLKPFLFYCFICGKEEDNEKLCFWGVCSDPQCQKSMDNYLETLEDFYD